MPKKNASVKLLLQKMGQHFSSLPLPVTTLDDEPIERVHTKGDCCMAVGVSGRCFVWGDLRKGLSLLSSLDHAETPVRCRPLEAMNFSEICLSSGTAVGIGSSVLLTVTFPEQEADDDEPMADIKKKKQQLHLFAVPCIDGELVENEGTLARLLQGGAGRGNDGFTVGLLNEYQLPWVERAPAKYPTFASRIRFGKAEDSGEDKDEGEEDDVSLEEEQSPVRGEDSEDGEEEQKDKESDEDEDGSEREAEPVDGQGPAVATVKKKATQKEKAKAHNMKERREKDTHVFTTRLNQEKTYFKGFAAKFEGIAEMESAEEQSVRLDTVPDEEQVVEVPLKVPSK